MVQSKGCKKKRKKKRDTGFFPGPRSPQKLVRAHGNQTARRGSIAAPTMNNSPKYGAGSVGSSDSDSVSDSDSDSTAESHRSLARFTRRH